MTTSSSSISSALGSSLTCTVFLLLAGRSLALTSWSAGGFISVSVRASSSLLISLCSRMMEAPVNPRMEPPRAARLPSLAPASIPTGPPTQSPRRAPAAGSPAPALVTWSHLPSTSLTSPLISLSHLCPLCSDPWVGLGACYTLLSGVVANQLLTVQRFKSFLINSDKATAVRCIMVQVMSGQKGNAMEYQNIQNITSKTQKGK